MILIRIAEFKKSPATADVRRRNPRTRVSAFPTLLLALLLLLGTSQTHAQQIIEADVCIYGGTSAGVVSAVQTVRMGKAVALAEFGKHLGGLSSGGLGQTDIGNKAAIGGISRDFYKRLGQHYGKAESWTFEPHVAENIFNQMIQESNVPVYFEQRLASVKKIGPRITEITMENGNVFRAKMFIDATYEGDLMAKAGVSYHVGREANSVYGETLNGVRAETWGNQLSVAVDPYVLPGNPASGLLPLIQPGNGGVPGAGDHRVQAYNFRMCLTQNTNNFRAIEPPPNYDPARFELLARYIEARVARGETLQLRQFFKLDMMPNGKTDSNNEGGFSTDYIGYNYDYPDADYARRAEIWTEHENYIRGFFTFLGTSPRVPEYLRNQMLSWGLSKDEFPDTEGWPHQLYVREARRMISDYIMTEKNCRGTIQVTDPVSLAAYNMDSHNVQRIVKNGAASNEGDVQTGVSPYPISYRAIIPKTNECANLLVPVCLSSSHIAYGSIRMEPVFMILGQSAATAACFAIDDGVALQDLNYAKLQLQLRADKQILEWGGNGATESGIIVDNSSTNGVVISAGWSTSTSVVGFYGANYLHDGNTGKGVKSVRFTPTLPTNGNYAVYLRWTTDPNRASSVPVDILHADGTSTVNVNQKNQNGQWVLIGNFNFSAGTNGQVVVRTTGTDGYVVVDAVRFGDSTPVTIVNVIATDADAAEQGAKPGKITFVRTGSTNAALTVNYLIDGTAQNGSDYQNLNGSVTIPAGSFSSAISMVPVADDAVEGKEMMTLTLSASTNYNIGAFGNATINIKDKPRDQWRKTHFTPVELDDESITGDGGDPDEDGLINLAEYGLGLDPNNPDVAGKPAVSIESDHLTLLYTRAKEATDVSLAVGVSSDFSIWNSGSNYVEEILVSDDGNIETRLARDKSLVQTNSMKFLRLRVIPR